MVRKIGAGFQQMNGERVAQRMRGDRFADAAQQPHLPAGPIDGERRDRLAGLSDRETATLRDGCASNSP